MGVLIAGRWERGGPEKAAEVAAPGRKPSTYRNVITAPGASQGDGAFVAEAERYHLYVSLACPWASRTLIMRRLKGLEDMIGVSVVHWHMGDDGWTFEPGDGVVPDPISGAAFLRDVYLLDDPDCTTRVSTPVLWDKVTGRIVSNESADIVRMFNSAFDSLGAREGDFYPLAARAEIDAVNDRILEGLNRGVYAAGFATSQGAYDAAVGRVFETLDWLEGRLGNRRYLVGSSLTEADIRLFVSLVRFDPVYVGHFKCDRKPLIDYPALWAYTRDLYQHPDIRPTVNFDHIRRHYYGSHPWVNPTGIVSIGPLRDFDQPTDRDRLSA